MADDHKKRRPLRAVLILAVLAVLTAGFVRWDNTALQTACFEPFFTRLPEGFDGCRLAVLSDLHGAEFGAGNRALFAAVSEAAPDYIFYLGDLEDLYRGPAAGYAETVAEGLSAIAPLYYVTGNHEWAIGGVPALKKRLEAHGAHILSNESVVLERNGDTVILAGVDDHNGYADQKPPEQVAEEVYAAHGAPVWLPFTDGLLSTERTLFPSYTAGFYEENGSALFVTRGLGNSGPTLRLFNRPEVAVVTLRRGAQ